MKKVYSSIVFLLLVLGSTVVTYSISAEELSFDEINEVVEEIKQIEKGSGYNFEHYTYILGDVHLANEERVGYVIDFQFNETKAYVILFRYERKLTIVELFMGKQSPFYCKKGMYIYPSLGSYFLKYEDKLYDLQNGELIDHLDLEDKNIFYAAKSKEKEEVSVKREVDYKYGTREEYEIYNFNVQYRNDLAKNSNNCANVAGIILLNYWNKEFNNDLLRLKDEKLHEGNIHHIYAGEVMSTFYKYMDTNWIFGVGGTLPKNFYKGFNRYVEENNYKTNRTSDLNFSSVKKNLRKGIPVVITSTDYYYAETGFLPEVTEKSGSNKLVMDYKRSYGLSNSHTFIGYGYAEYTLYKMETKTVSAPVWYNPFKTKTVSEWVNHKEELVLVANGWGTRNYFNYNVSNVHENSAVEVIKK